MTRFHPSTSSSSEKVLVVLLVASGTVCFLTNLLVLVILLRQLGRNLCLRYQIIKSQAWTGRITALVTLYPLKVKNETEAQNTRFVSQVKNKILLQYDSNKGICFRQQKIQSFDLLGCPEN